MNKLRRRWIQSCSFILLLTLSACQTGSVQTEVGEPGKENVGINAQPLSSQYAWVLQKFSNQSHTHTAADVAAVLLETHLYRRGITASNHTSFVNRYVVSGEVIDWHYTAGISPKPSVGLQLFIRDLQSDTIVWSDAIAGEGSRRESLSAYADSLMASLVDRFPLTDAAVRHRGEQSAPALSPQPVIPVDSNALHASGAMVSIDTKQAGANVSASVSGALAINTAVPSFSGTELQTSQVLSGRSVAFFYAANPPIDVLSQFDKIVLEPDNISQKDLVQLTASGASAFAYLSVGEVGPHRAYASLLLPEWILGKNPAWNSDVLDLSNSRLRQFLLGRVKQLQEAGYDGIFLDTMDSFNLVADTDSEKALQRAGLIKFIKDLGSLKSPPRIITNRGFEVLDAVAEHVEAVAAESLYASWNNEQQTYSTVPEEARSWLMAKLEHARNTLSLDVIVIDYQPPEQRVQARAIAKKIAEHGFIPWVANPSLDYMGVGALEALPRKVLMVYDSSVDGQLDQAAVHKFAAMPIEYLGYVPEYLDIANEEWPTFDLKGRYAGIVTWANRELKRAGAASWIQKQLDDSVPMVFMGMPPVNIDSRMARSLGIEVSGDMHVDSARPSFQGRLIKPERSLSPRLNSIGLIARSVVADNDVHMSLQDKNGVSSDVVVTGNFGGFAWHPGDVQHGLNYEVFWVVEPFEFFRKALRLPDAPMPDVTTENGKRLWLAHIDGDALPSWAEMPGQLLGAEIIYENILKKYPLPHTVSVVEGEMTAFPAYADRRQRMFDIARKTFELKHVELASHTYSHPFKWHSLVNHRSSGKYNLDIPGYSYSAERDIAGSLAFIDENLAPADKNSSVMLWSGDALPGIDELAVLDRLGLPNMNGGITSVTNSTKTMSLISPMARPVGPYLQVYAPIMNENIYTNDWLGPFDGFNRVLETFELTEQPRRLKPINVYYHFYSGTKISALKALDEVYAWSTRQDIFPLHVSDYSRKVPDFRKAGVGRYLNGEWKISNLGSVRSLRILGQESWPRMGKSNGLVGARKLHDGIYLHTNGANQVQFRLGQKKPTLIHLVSSNGKIQRWVDNNGRLELRIAGEVPVKLELSGAATISCKLRANGKTVKGRRTANSSILYSFTKKDTGDATLNCPA